MASLKEAFTPSDENLYCWFSPSVSDGDLGRKVTDKAGVKHTHIGFGIIADTKTGALYQYNQGSHKLEEKPPGADWELAATLPRNSALLVMTGFGEITPYGVSYCEERGLPVTAENLIAQVANFREPKTPPGYTPEPLDLRKLKSSKNSAPPKG
jgi:hypothetical protein